MKILHLLLLLTLSIPAAIAQDRPNILWITAEDYSSSWLGCYGNKQALTPNIDSLADRGVLFTAAFSNGPVCAIARTTIITGVYAPTLGSQHMRSRKPVPKIYRPYVSYLKDLGYYCTNRGKTDYNIKMDDKSIWDSCAWGSFDFSTLPKDKPFFTVINLGETHESSLFASKIKANRKRGIIPKKTRLSTEQVIVPPYLPSIPGIRHDIAIYHDNMTAMDSHVGEILEQLKQSGQADNTIIFHYSDHGGVLPRGKRYLTDTGTRPSMIIYFPKKWQHLCPFQPGERVDEPVSFVDLAPTLLSILGQDKPKQMVGRAFLGSKRVPPAKDEVEFLYADRFDEIYGMRRGITDGRWKYIRRFTPHLPAAPYCYYQFGQEGWTDWEKRWQKGTLKPQFNTIWEPNQVVEELFDTQSDPWEIHNLADSPKYAKKRIAMRNRLKKEMLLARDTGLIPEGMFSEIVPANTPIANYWTTHSDDLAPLLDLAFQASARDINNLPHFIEKLKSPNPLTRYWAAQGCLILGKKSAPAETAIRALLTDKHSNVRVAAQQTLIAIGHKKEGIELLIKGLAQKNNEFATLDRLNAIIRAGAFDQIPQAWIQQQLKSTPKANYVTRCLERAKKHEASKRR